MKILGESSLSNDSNKMVKVLGSWPVFSIPMIEIEYESKNIDRCLSHKKMFTFHKITWSLWTVLFYTFTYNVRSRMISAPRRIHCPPNQAASVAMHPIYEASDEESKEPLVLPPMRPCSTVTDRPTLMNSSKFNRRVSFVNRSSIASPPTSRDTKKNKSRSVLQDEESFADASDESVETITSYSLYSLRNHAPKRDLSFSDYIFCQASFSDFVEEVKGTYDDVASAVDQVLHAFVISDEDIDRISKVMQSAEKDIDEHIAKGIRDIGITRS